MKFLHIGSTLQITRLVATVPTWKLYKPTFDAMLEIIISHINHTKVFIVERL